MSKLTSRQEKEELLVPGRESSASILERKKGFRYFGSFACATFLGATVFGALGLYWQGRRDTLSTGFQETLGKGTDLPVVANHTAITAAQIENFRNGEGILFNFHITHHGGTTICTEFRNLTSPSFACMHPKEEDHVPLNYPEYMPWENVATEENIDIVHQHFRFISWEFRKAPFKNKPQIHDMDFENPRLVTLFVARDPLSRLLAGDGFMARDYPAIFKEHNGTEVEWWKFAKEARNDNYALGILSDFTCCNGENTSSKYLEMAKKLIQRFTFVLDIACLETGMEKVAQTLGFSLQQNFRSQDSRHMHSPVKDRIPFPDIYDYLRERNKVDMELYEFAKAIALVDCEVLQKKEEEE